MHAAEELTIEHAENTGRLLNRTTRGFFLKHKVAVEAHQNMHDRRDLLRVPLVAT